MALAAAEAVPQTAVSVGNDVLSASVGAGYPNSRVNSSCIKTSFEFAQAFKAGTQRCVSPCLFGRFVDTNADPVRFFFSHSLSFSLVSLFLTSRSLFLLLLSSPRPFTDLEGRLPAPSQKRF